jgi:hypothetical protein
MQDVVAIAVACLAAAWLVRTFARQCFTPPCSPPSGAPEGDGFVPLEALKKAGASRRPPLP